MFDKLGLAARTAVALVRRPDLCGTAIRQLGRLAPQRWWSSGSRLPIPTEEYLAFRNVTLSGNAAQLPTVNDVVVYLEWCRSMQALPPRG